MKPGDKVEVVPSPCLTTSAMVGRRGVVVPLDAGRLPMIIQLLLEIGAKPMPGHEFVAVDFGESEVGTLCISALRKIDDDDRPATWDDVEKLTGWKRPAVPA